MRSLSLLCNLPHITNISLIQGVTEHVRPFAAAYCARKNNEKGSYKRMLYVFLFTIYDEFSVLISFVQFLLQNIRLHSEGLPMSFTKFIKKLVLF